MLGRLIERGPVTVDATRVTCNKVMPPVLLYVENPGGELVLGKAETPLDKALNLIKTKISRCNNMNEVINKINSIMSFGSLSTDYQFGYLCEVLTEVISNNATKHLRTDSELIEVLENMALPKIFSEPTVDAYFNLLHLISNGAGYHKFFNQSGIVTQIMSIANQSQCFFKHHKDWEAIFLYVVSISAQGGKRDMLMNCGIAPLLKTMVTQKVPPLDKIFAQRLVDIYNELIRYAIENPDSEDVINARPDLTSGMLLLVQSVPEPSKCQLVNKINLLIKNVPELVVCFANIISVKAQTKGAIAPLIKAGVAGSLVKALEGYDVKNPFDCIPMFAILNAIHTVLRKEPSTRNPFLKAGAVEALESIQNKLSDSDDNVSDFPDRIRIIIENTLKKLRVFGCFPQSIRGVLLHRRDRANG